MSIFEVRNQQMVRKDAASASQQIAVDTENILGGGAGATTNTQALLDGISSDLSGQVGAISAIVNVYGSKNLLDNNTPSKTENGVTFTVNDDKSVTVSTGAGGATADTAFDILSYDIPAGNYTASGITGGSTSTYLILVYNNNYTDVTYVQDGDTPLTLTGNYMRRIRILIKSGQVLTTPIVFYPMIRDARIKDSTYVPYVPTNRELMPWDVNAKYGVHNILPKTQTLNSNNGGTVVYNDGIHAFDVTCPAASSPSNPTGMYFSGNRIKDVIATDAGVVNRPLRVSFQYKASSAVSCVIGSERSVSAITAPTSWTKYEGIITIGGANNNYSNVVFYSRSTDGAITINVKDFCISLAEDTDKTYQPHAMTNQQLTDAVTSVKTDITTGCSTNNTNVTVSSATWTEVGNIVMFNLFLSVATGVTVTSDVVVTLPATLPSLTNRDYRGHGFSGSIPIFGWTDQWGTSKTIKVRPGAGGMVSNGNLSFILVK